ncbi:DUF4097 family beta strand repeat-containing protein [Blastococcus sp. TF02A_35]|uniref:DUF4097 family beta strand repeat-containing protein n=1 Tax=Blastococcus sp. TF02A-35 TaxID=2559612 RepID=UPI00107312A8|nr:DUF4097 family beta strand repeat-containing protein [Blastococcus sp. TF02A_35]TFV52896.1 hypothetical protein E4P43_04690 [Blastococcus sp. TF02A_35]
MLTFETPGPVTARIEVAAGTVRVRATQRTTTQVDVRPANPGRSGDVEAARQTRVELTDGRLLVSTPRKLRLVLFGPPASVEIDVLVPEGSEVHAESGFGDVDCEGRFADVRVTSKCGDVRIDRAAEVTARSSAGDVEVGEADGGVEAGTAYGQVRVGSARGDVRLHSSAGDIWVDRALGSVHATTKYGQVRVAEAVRGELVLETAYGTVEAGIRQGTAAWLDLQAGAGRVRNLLDAAEGPDDAVETVEVRARTAYGDVIVRRS